MFDRFAFEAYQKAARLRLDHQEVHDLYIMTGQKMGRLDDIHQEYKDLAKKYPDNELVQRCLKNMLSISMAMIPDKVAISGMAMSKKMNRLMILLALGLMFIGAVLIFGSPFLHKAKLIKKEQLKHLVQIGVLLEGAALAGFIARSLLK